MYIRRAPQAKIFEIASIKIDKSMYNIKIKKIFQDKNKNPAFPAQLH